MSAGLGIVLQHKYTEQQQAFVHNVANGMDRALAAESAGYAKENARIEAHRLLQQPAIVAAVQIELARRLAIGAPLALNVMQDFALDPSMHPKIRLDSAKALLAMAGFVPPKAKDTAKGVETPLNEMSMSQLRDLADKLEGEIAGRAKEVSSAKLAPHDTQAIDDII